MEVYERLVDVTEGRPQKQSSQPASVAGVSGFSDVGKVRKNNEDSMYVNGTYYITNESNQRVEVSAGISSQQSEKDGELVIVSDGMGDIMQAKSQSRVMIQEIVKAYYGNSWRNENAQSRLKHAIEEANKTLLPWGPEAVRLSWWHCGCRIILSI